jgi:hypothetical protein
MKLGSPSTGSQEALAREKAPARGSQEAPARGSQVSRREDLGREIITLESEPGFPFSSRGRGWGRGVGEGEGVNEQRMEGWGGGGCRVGISDPKSTPPPLPDLTALTVWGFCLILTIGLVGFWTGFSSRHRCCCCLLLT